MEGIVLEVVEHPFYFGFLVNGVTAKSTGCTFEQKSELKQNRDKISFQKLLHGILFTSAWIIDSIFR